MCGSFFFLLLLYLLHCCELFLYLRSPFATTLHGEMDREGLCKRCKWCLREGCIVFLGTEGTVSCKLAHKLFKNFFHPSKGCTSEEISPSRRSLHCTTKADDKALELFVMCSCDKMPPIECKSVRVYTMELGDVKKMQQHVRFPKL